MIHRTILSTFGFLVLATCQTSNVSQTAAQEKTQTVKTPKTPKPTSTPATPATPKNNEPEMSTGMPPDAEAKKVAEQEQRASATSKSGVIYLNEGENKFLKAYEMNVTFKKVTEDSRCPKGVNCVWEGAATAEVEVMGLATRPVTLRLSTLNNAQKGFSKSQQFNGYTITLAELSPETTANKGFKALQGSYKIGLRFDKAGAGTASPAGTTTK